jgi:hypothetical protein
MPHPLSNLPRRAITTITTITAITDRPTIHSRDRIARRFHRLNRWYPSHLGAIKGR